MPLDPLPGCATGCATKLPQRAAGGRNMTGAFDAWVGVQHLQFGRRRRAPGAADIEWNALVRHHLLQEQPDGIARLEAARGQNSDGAGLEPGIDTGTNDSVFHALHCSYILWGFGVWLAVVRRLGVLITSQNDMIRLVNRPTYGIY